MQYCPYHGKDFDDSEPFSEEHVLQLSLGGPSSLSIEVSKDANSRLGTEVDSQLVNNFFLTHHRLKHKLAGQSGTVPEIEFNGILKDLPEPTKVKYRYGINGPKYWLQPKVEMTPQEDGRTLLNLGASSEEEIRTIVANLNRKRKKQGESEIDPEMVIKSAVRISIPTPTIHSTFNFDTSSFKRAYVKMTLGFAHRVLGEKYSRSPGADLLRRFMWEPECSKREHIPLRGNIFPDLRSEDFGEYLFISDKHVIGIPENSPPCVFISLFGDFPGIVALAEEYDEALFGDLPPGGIYWVIDPTIRHVDQFSISELIAYKMRNKLPPFDAPDLEGA